MPRSAPAAARCFLAEGDPPSKRAILCAALGLFVEHGLDGTSIRMIAEEAGYTNPALFKFFASKDALALHLFERCYERLYARLEPAAARAPFRAALAGVLDAFVTLVDEDLEAVLFVQDALRELWPRLPASARKRSILRLLRDLVARGVREGAVGGYRSPEVPVAVIVGALGQFARMTWFDELPPPAGERREELELALTRMLKG